MMLVANFCQYKMMQKCRKNYCNPGILVLIWEYSVRAIQWIPTWKGLHGFQMSLHPCALNESSLSIRRVKGEMLLRKTPQLAFKYFISCQWLHILISLFREYSLISLTLSLLRLLPSKALGRKYFWKSSKCCLVGINWIALSDEYACARLLVIL